MVRLSAGGSLRLEAEARGTLKKECPGFTNVSNPFEIGHISLIADIGYPHTAILFDPGTGSGAAGEDSYRRATRGHMAHSKR
jgi:hypothetical protein